MSHLFIVLETRRKVGSIYPHNNVETLLALHQCTAIQGIDEGIRGMRSGGIRRMNIPPNLAFIEGVGDDKPVRILIQNNTNMT